jgi:hypothetical protein
MSKLDQDRSGIDPAALAAATLGAAITVIGPPGPYNAGGSLMGGALLLVIIGFDIEPLRSRKEVMAFSAAFALIAWLVVAFPVEVVCSGLFGAGYLHGKEAALARLGTLNNEHHFAVENGNEFARQHDKEFDEEDAQDIDYSTVPPIVHIGSWVLIFAAVYKFDVRRSDANRFKLASNRQTPTGPTSPPPRENCYTVDR